MLDKQKYKKIEFEIDEYLKSALVFQGLCKFNMWQAGDSGERCRSNSADRPLPDGFKGTFSLFKLFKISLI
jgi:hypothetical protein